MEPVCLPERELQLRPAAYSRQWENARLSALYRMARGDAPVVVTTAAALVQRCLSREVLLAAAFSLEVGARYDVQDLCRRLTLNVLLIDTQEQQRTLRLCRQRGGEHGPVNRGQPRHGSAAGNGAAVQRRQQLLKLRQSR